MKVYIAGRYSRRDELKDLSLKLEAMGIGVTSRWLNEKEPLEGGMDSKPGEWYRETAIVDLEDIDRADGILLFSEDPKVGIPRGGRQVEFGYAIGTGKQLHIIGPFENIFHFLPSVRHYDDIYDFAVKVGAQCHA
jgi:hypothetical protein